MNTLKLLENENIRNFVFDDSNKKVLIGSRRIGKTYALALSAFRNMVSEDRDGVYLVSSFSQAKIIVETLEKIALEYNYDCTITKASYVSIVTIDNSILYIGTIEAVTALLRGGRRVEDMYVDEPSYLQQSLTELTDNFIQIKSINSNCKMILAGSYNQGTNEILVGCGANGSFNRYIAKHEEDSCQYIESIDNVPWHIFKREILCEL